MGKIVTPISVVETLKGKNLDIFLEGFQTGSHKSCCLV